MKSYVNILELMLKADYQYEKGGQLHVMYSDKSVHAGCINS
jgi:hypothetical protein